jgi:hypothetical protein
MLIPSLQYGDWNTVKKRMRTAIADVAQDGDIGVMTAAGMLDTDAVPGMLIMAGITRGTTPHFHCFMPWKPLWEALFDLRPDPTTPIAIEDAIFAASLRVPWGVLGLLSPENQPWIIPSRFESFLQAVLAVWDELDAVGERYYAAVQGKRLWHVHTNLHFVLARQGVPHEQLRTPLPPEGPRALLAQLLS